jgi:hypothetical protein
MASSDNIAVIVFTSSHCTGLPNIYSSLDVGLFVAGVHHSLRAPLRPTNKTLIWKMLFFG